MSTEPQTPSKNQTADQGTTENAAIRGSVPAQREQPPAAIGERSPEEARRRLEQLASQANLAHELVKDAALRFCRHSVEAGMALLEAHDLCPAGTWGAWLKDHFDGSARTAQRYMKQAKTLLLLGVKTTDLSFFHPEEVSRVFDQAIRRIERQRATAPARSDGEANIVVAVANRPDEINKRAPSPLSSDDPLLMVLALFNELMAAICSAIESGQWLDYGQFVLDELERIRADVDACRMLLSDARPLMIAPREAAT